LKPEYVSDGCQVDVDFPSKYRNRLVKEWFTHLCWRLYGRKKWL